MLAAAREVLVPSVSLYLLDQQRVRQLLLCM
jgi:hypothetical protein